MTPRFLLRTALLIAVFSALTGCSTLLSASKPQDSYELQPLHAANRAARSGGRHLLVELPTATGAIASDRIVVKPSALQVQSLPGVRWVDGASAHVQLLMVRSLAATGRFGLVTGPEPGPLPDLVLLTDLFDFQAEFTTGDEAIPANVVVGLTLTLVRDSGSVVATRRFETTVSAQSTGTDDVLAAFDAATTQVLEEAVGWVTRVAG